MKPSAWQWASALALLAAIALGSAVRIQTTFAQPGFDAQRPEKIFKADPGLIFYVTKRIVAAGGLPPDDFRADPRVEHPAASDLPAMLTVGQEFLVAWSYLLFGGDMPLHVFCVIAMGIVASLSAIGVWGLALELTRKAQWAAFAVLLYAILVANYRTIGFVLVREDLSLPLFALHLWLLARAARVRTPASIGLAALALVGAAATWHAMGFVLALEAACIFAWFLRSGENPFASPRAWVFLAVVALGSLCVPVLRAKLFALSAPVQIGVALLAVGLLDRGSTRSALSRRLVAVAIWLACLGLSLAVNRLVAGGLGDYGHVVELLWAKLRFAGELPDDPKALGFGARLLWQGPFEGGSLRVLLQRLGVAGVLLPVAVLAALPGWWRGRGDARLLLLHAFAVVCAGAAILIKRTDVLVGLVAPVVVAVLLRELRPVPALAWMLGLGLVQGDTFAHRIENYTTRRWYPPQHQEELARAVEWIREELPPEGAVAADLISSTAVLVHTAHPIVHQPKYETRRSRERLQIYFSTLYQGSTADLHRVLVDAFEARYLLLDLGVLWRNRYLGGVPRSARALPPSSAAARFLDADPRVYRDVPGFRLLYESGDSRPVWLLYELEATTGTSPTPQDP